MSNVEEILQQVLSTDGQVRHNSQQRLQQEKEKSPQGYLLELSKALASSAIPVPARQLSGILLKNTLLNLNNETFLSGLWQQVPEPSKAEILNNTLASLAAEDRSVRLSASQAVSALIKLDLPQKRCLQMIQILVQNATSQNPAYKEASLTTLDYLCDGLDPSILTTGQVDSIVTAIAASMMGSEENNEIVIIAIKAFKSSIKLAKKNFEVQPEREFILRLILTGCQSPHEGIRTESYRLLIESVSQYYDFIGQYLPDLARTTFQTIKVESGKVALLALEVWNIIGDCELERKENSQLECPVRGYLNSVHQDLLRLVLDNIHKVQGDEDEWDVNKACASVLSVLAQLAEDKVVDEALKYLRTNMKSLDWRYRHSSMLVIGSILEGPSNTKLASIAEVVPSVIAALNDPSAYVKLSAAWALSKIAQHQYKIISQPLLFNSLLKALLESLKDSPKIACRACWALASLIEKSSKLSLFNLRVFESAFSALINSALPPDTSHPDLNLQTSAFFALSTLIAKSPEDCVNFIESQISSFIVLFKQTAGQGGNEHLHNSLCEVLGSCFTRARNVSDAACKEFLQALDASFNAQRGVYEEGIMALGAMTICIGPRFLNYLQTVGPFILFILQKQDVTSLLKAGTMLIGDIARALGDLGKGFVADLIQPLISNLRSKDTSSQVKVQSIESLADVVSNCKESTVPYLNDVLALIDEAAVASISNYEGDDADLADYFRQLREAVIEFYENLVQGLMSQAGSLYAYVPNIVAYVMTASLDKFKPKLNIHGSAIGIIGDLCKIYGKSIDYLVKTQAVMVYVQKFRISNNFKIRELANWAFGLLNHI